MIDESLTWFTRCESASWRQTKRKGFGWVSNSIISPWVLSVNLLCFHFGYLIPAPYGNIISYFLSDQILGYLDQVTNWEPSGDVQAISFPFPLDIGLHVAFFSGKTTAYAGSQKQSGKKHWRRPYMQNLTRSPKVVDPGEIFLKGIISLITLQCEHLLFRLPIISFPYSKPLMSWWWDKLFLKGHKLETDNYQNEERNI